MTSKGQTAFSAAKTFNYKQRAHDQRELNSLTLKQEKFYFLPAKNSS